MSDSVSPSQAGGSGPSGDQLVWAATFCNKDPQAIAAPPPGGSAAAPAPWVKSFSFDIPAYKPKPLPLMGGKVTVKGQLGASIKGKASIDDGDESHFDWKKISIELGSKWVGATVPDVLEKNGLSEKLKLEGAKITAAKQTPIGLLSLEITLIGVDKELSHDGVVILPKVMEGELSLQPIAVRMPDDTEIEGLKLTELMIQVGGKISIGPDVKEILKDWLIKQAEQRGIDAAKSTAEEAGEAALAGIAFETIITVGLIAGGIAAIVETVRAIALGDEYKSLGDDIAAAWKGLDAGWRAGASGGGAPSGQWGALGHKAGQPVYDTAFKKVKGDFPAAAEADIKKQISDYINKTYAEGIPYETGVPLHHAVRVAAWHGFLGNHSGRFSFLSEGEAKLAFQVCFTDNPSSDAARYWKEYLDQHSIGSHL